MILKQSRKNPREQIPPKGVAGLKLGIGGFQVDSQTDR